VHKTVFEVCYKNHISASLILKLYSSLINKNSSKNADHPNDIAMKGTAAVNQETEATTQKIKCKQMLAEDNVTLEKVYTHYTRN